MSRKYYTLSNPPQKVIDFMETVVNNSEFLKQLVVDYIDKKLIYAETIDADLITKYRKLKNLNLQFKTWNLAKKEGYSLQQYMGMVQEEEFKYPENRTFTSTSQTQNDEEEQPGQQQGHQFRALGTTIVHPKKSPESPGLDKNWFCDFCKHAHAESEPHVCKEIHCNCGVRG